jgi:hypothetical protein
MLINLLSEKFPSGDATDGQYLYRSLGSFWTQIFQDKNVLRAYTLGMAEELIQSYYKLEEVINQYAIKDIPLYSRKKWQPLIIKKSDFNKTPFVFETDGAIFGVQPDTDNFYQGQVFRFGFPKGVSTAHVYSFTPKEKLVKFGAVANRLIDPSILLIPGSDVILKNGTLYFNTNLFDNTYIPRAKLIGDLNAPVVYVDDNGNTQQDEFIVLWLYHAELDADYLYANFGSVLNIHLPTEESYKTILQAIFNLAVEGPTITALRTAFSAFANAPTVIEAVETVEDIYPDNHYNYVITDKNVYKLALDRAVNTSIEIGGVLYAGDPITNDVKVVDSTIDHAWWHSEITTNKIAFASHVFAANVKRQLFFENAVRQVNLDVTTVYTETGPTTVRRLTFPVLGAPEDVASFQEYINQEDYLSSTGVKIKGNKNTIIDKLQFARNISASTPINPVDFVFNNLFKNNTLLLKLDFYTNSQLQLFFSLLPNVRQYLPSHVYLIIYLQLKLTSDDFGNLNKGLTIPGFDGDIFSVDGSVRLSGARPGDPTTDPEYYKDYKNRMFCVALGPYRNPVPPHEPSAYDEPLHTYNNLDELSANNAVDSNTQAGVRCGTMRTEIPEYITLPGDTQRVRPSTREIPAILLIDF